MAGDPDDSSPGLDAAIFAAPGSAALTRLTAVDTVRARILLSVEHGLLTEGTRLPRLELIAEGLEVSPITARRALESLVAQGVLVRRPGRGGGTFVARVASPTPDASVAAYRADAERIRLLIDQRSLMESAIVFELARTATTQQCAELDRLIVRSQRATSWLEHHRPDSEFHRLCARWSGLPEAHAYLSVYETLLRYFVPYPMSELEAGRDDHRALVSAFRAHDRAAAVSITRRHVDALRREMFVALPLHDRAEPAHAADRDRSRRHEANASSTT